MRGIDISFIIPAYNEEIYIGNAINSINNCMHDIGYTYEIVVIDNGSYDKTAKIAHEKNVAVESITRTSISNARNTGAKLAQGKIIVFVDADVRLTIKWGDKLKKKFFQILNEKIVIGSKYSVRENPSYIEKYWFKPLSLKKTNYINGGNIIVSKKTFTTIDGFNSAYETGEDVEFCQRALKMGINIILDNGFEAIHDGFPTNIKHFIKREIWHGKGDYISFKSFFNSSVAKSASIFAIFHYAILANIFVGNYVYIWNLIAAIIAMTTLISVRIFLFASWLNVIINIPLCYIYLASRHISFFASYCQIWCLAG